MINCIFAVILGFIFMVLIGELWNKIGQKREYTLAESLIPGFFLVLCIMEGVNLFCMKLDFTFSIFLVITGILLSVLCLISIVIGRKEFWKHFIIRPVWNGKTVIWILIFVLQIMVIFHFSPEVKEDNTMEIIRTTLSTDTISMYHPMTGLAYQSGPTLHQKLMILPNFYAFFIKICHAEPGLLVYRIVPVFLLLMSYISCYLLAKEIFLKVEVPVEKRQLFLIFYGGLLLFGDYLFTMVSYRIFHCGWMGESIVISMILPYLISLFLHLIRVQKKKIYGDILNLFLTIGVVFLLMDAIKGGIYIAITLLIFMLALIFTEIIRKAGNRHC